MPEWAEPLRPLITEWVYRRGFVEWVEASLEVPAARIAETLRLAPIRHIRDAGQFCELDGLVEALPHLRHLTGLEFWTLYAFETGCWRQSCDLPTWRDSDADLPRGMRALEREAGVGMPADPALIEVASGAVEGYKRMAYFAVDRRSRAEVVVEHVLPPFGPAIISGLLKGYDSANSWEAAGR